MCVCCSFCGSEKLYFYSCSPSLPLMLQLRLWQKQKLLIQSSLVALTKNRRLQISTERVKAAIT